MSPDDDDLDLFSYLPHARASDPETSHEAVPVHITAQALRILRSYWDGDALLDHQAYVMAGMGSARAKSQRCSDLRHLGLIERTGERALTPSGATGYLCRITDAGRKFLVGKAA
jgi:hypothetical protein